MDASYESNDGWDDSKIKGFSFDDTDKGGSASFWDTPTDENIKFLTARPGNNPLPTSLFSAEPAVKLIQCTGPCGRELKPSDRYYRMYLPYCKQCLDAASQPEKPPASASSQIEWVSYILKQKLKYQIVLTDWLGDPLFRTMDGKRLLLLKAVQLGDGDSIIAALLFLRRTLKPTVFKEEVCRNELRGQALLHWLAYLQQAEEVEEFKDCLLSYVPAATGEPPNVDAVAAINLERVLANNSEPATRASALRRFLASETGASKGLLSAGQTCLDLLNQQMNLEKTLAEKMLGKPPDLFPLLRGRQPVTFLTLNAFAEQLQLLEPDLERLSPGLASLTQLSGLMVSAKDQAAWCRIVAIATRLRQATETRNEPEILRQHNLMEGAVLERGSGFIQKQLKPVLSWPVPRQLDYLRRLGASETLLEKLRKLG